MLAQVDEPALRHEEFRWPWASSRLWSGRDERHADLVSSIIGCIALVVTRCIDRGSLRGDRLEGNISAGRRVAVGLGHEKSARHNCWRNRRSRWGPFGPVVVLAVLYLLTALLTEFMSNNATAVLMAPSPFRRPRALSGPQTVSAGGVLRGLDQFRHPLAIRRTRWSIIRRHPVHRLRQTGIPLILIFWGLAVYFIPKWWPFERISIPASV